MSASKRRIDHLVLAVHDLDRAAAGYEQLGFSVGARNRHPWGTENRVIQFRSSFLELITVADAGLIPPHRPHHFSLGAFVRDSLAHREGPAMLVLDSADAPADAAHFARAGIGDLAPFSFEREGRAADGTRTRVAFTLAFALDDQLPEVAFFTCQQHFPDAFWSPDQQQHANGATNVVDVSLDVALPVDHTNFLDTFAGTASEDGQLFTLAAGGSLHLTSTAGTGLIAGFTVAVPSIAAVRESLRAESVPSQELPDRIVIAADQCFGARVELERSDRGAG